ncbi:MAG: radical SAM protein [Nanoarchaeota archaeon]|nr:radical SAM protein [DPANN group archaeon]MBL7116898.1 radical SAM protein [Nanoarchaeota archaeon]
MLEKIKRKSLLYKSGVEYADFCINHVEGCSHGCTFPCYAMNMAKRFGRIKTYYDWIKPKLVDNAIEILDEEIPKYKDEIKFVHLCFMTDPFMCGYKEVEYLTLKIIARLNKDDIKCTVLTKGIYPKVLKNTEKFGANNEYGITLVSLDENFKKKWEPYSAKYEERINSLKYLHEQGLKTWVSIEPYPTPNIVEQDLLEILNKISFVDTIIFGKLNYNTKSNIYVNGNGDFYENCAKQVIDFCKKNNIDYHIKFGTMREHIPKKTILFEGASKIPVMVE